MFMKSKSVLGGLAVAALLAVTPARATEILFDNGKAIDNASVGGGTGYDNNESSGWQVYDNFSFSRDNTIESVRFQMAGGTEPFTFSVYEDDMGKPGKEIFSQPLNAGDYSFGPATEFLNRPNPPDIGHEFSFSPKTPLTLVPGTYWLSFFGSSKTNTFYTLGAGHGDGFKQRQFKSGMVFDRPGNTSFQLIGTPVDAAVAFIDIKPGSADNPINPRSNGVIPVAVLGSIDFDATQIDVATIVFGPGGAPAVHGGHVQDANNDGFMDMLFHFGTAESGIACGDTEAFLSGKTFAGQSFGNFDSITTVGCTDPGPGPGTGPGNVTADGATTGSGGTAFGWTLLPVLLLLNLLGFYRRRIAAR